MFFLILAHLIGYSKDIKEDQANSLLHTHLTGYSKDIKEDQANLLFIRSSYSFEEEGSCDCALAWMSLARESSSI